MPAYDYLCDACGPFTAVRPMAEFQLPHICDVCGESARRAILTAPAFAGMDGVARHASATNERSSHAPTRAKRHPASCGCCKSGRTADTGRVAEAVTMKGAPAKRPWMISH